MISTFRIGVDAGTLTKAGSEACGADSVSIGACMVQYPGDCRAHLIYKNFQHRRSIAVRVVYDRNRPVVSRIEQSGGIAGAQPIPLGGMSGGPAGGEERAREL